MAVAGLHNVSVLDSSFLRESQSSVLRQWGNQDRPHTRASSLLQMWRELEGEHVASHPLVRLGERPRQQRGDVSNSDFATTYFSIGSGHENIDSSVDANEVENECETFPQIQMGSQNGSSSSELSTDFAEVERERVRQNFQEWMNSDLTGHSSNVSHLNNCSGVQWLGENERERVRIVREWVELTSRQRGTCHGGREEQVAAMGSQIERIRDGQVVDRCEIGSRRAIRRLCGRQALLDLLTRAERERKRELQDLLEYRSVSDFGHRNRIQSLLRGRFLRNERFIKDERPNSMAASELGLLRQRHTVSGLREGFLSRLDNSVCGPLGSAHFDDTASDEINGHRDDHTRANSLQEVPAEFSDQSAPTDGEEDISVFHTDDIKSDTGGCINQQESTSQVEERQEQVLENVEREQPSNVVFIERREDANGEDVVGNGQGSNGYEWSRETLGIEGIERGTLLEAHDVFRERYEPSSEERDVQGTSDPIHRLVGNTVENFNMQDTSAQVEEESLTEIGESDWQQLASVDPSEWRDGSVEGMDGNLQETSHRLYQETSENDDAEQSHLQESHEELHENRLQEAMSNWLDEPSGQEVAPVGRIDTFYFSDDDSGHSLELRELLSRRRVSNLLRSGFRESLDQLIQSYLERQGHASVEWEPDRMSPPLAVIELDQEEPSGDQNVDESEAIERTPLVLPSPPVTPFPTIWDQDLHDANWERPNSHRRLGIEWEIINDLRIDMARLQQRMNNMQRMLEACMDMQLELQRSVQQEVSAALNRSYGSTDASEDNFLTDESKWDHVRKGICCICCDSSIDSLLYRCGHMCACSKCANKLVEGKGKCPMCQAPVVEVIRAYSVQ